MSSRSHASHPLLRSRATVALIGLLALVFTGLSVSQAHAAAAPAGTYTGTSNAFTDAPVSFDIDASGTISNFYAENYCQSSIGPILVQWVGIPAISVEAGQSFSVDWEYGDDPDFRAYYELTGTVNADGTAAGTGRAGYLPYGTCGGEPFTWQASTVVEDPDPVYEPTASVSPSELTESELADSGVVIEGQDFAPNTDVELAINGSAITTEESLYNGNVLFDYSSSDLGAGTHDVVLTSGSLSASTSFTVNADAPVYDPQVVVSPKTITQSEVADNGISVTATGFPANEEIALTVVENEAGGIVVTDADGSVTVTGWMIGDTSPGERTLSARVGEVFATDTFMVTADAPVYNPQMSVSPTSLTLSEAQEDGVEVSITGFPAQTEISVGVLETQSGEVIETDADGSVFFESYTLGGLGAGTYTLSAIYEDLSAQAVVTVTEDDPVYDPQVTVDPDTVTLDELADSGVTVTGAGFPESDFITLTVGGFVIEGTTTDASGGVVLDYTSTDLSVGDHVVQLAHNDIIATTTLTVEENEPVYDPQADASPSTLTESELIDPGVTIIGTDFPADETVTLTVAGDPAGTETADANGDVEFTFRSDSLGTGSHDAVLTSGDLSASTTFTVTEDAPVYNPQAAVNPTTLTESELAESGVTVTGSDFPANEVVNLTVDGVAAGSQTADADGTVAIGYITDTLAPGTYSAQLTNGDLTAGASFTVEADPAPVYDPEISLSTPEVTVSVLADEGVEVTGTGFPENATVTLFFDGTEVVSGDTDADGAVVFTLWAENYPLGQYTVSLEADAEGAQVATTLTLIADEEGEDPAPVTIPAAEPNPADLTPALQGAVEIPAAAAPGDRIVLTVTGVDPGTEVGVWIFSEATYLGTHTVDGNGQVTVILPADLPEGTHTISVWTNEGLVGWDTIAVSSDGDAGPTDPEDGTAESGDQLAVTGGTLAVGTLAGGALLLVIGFGLVLLARTRAKVIA